MGAQTLSFTDRLVIEECYKCSCNFAMPQYLQRQAREKGREFFCPNGHSQVYIETEVKKERRLREQAEHQRDAARASRDRAVRQRDSAQRRASAYKGHATRQRKRAGAGVCPVQGCKRHFQNLASHMRQKHPGWRDAEVAS